MTFNKLFTTLQGRLLRWLILPLVVLSMAHLLNIYITTKNTSTELFDRVLVNLALSISQYAISSEGDFLTADLLDVIKQTTNDTLFYKMLGPDGSFLVGYTDLPDPPDGVKKIHNHIEYYDVIYLGQPLRIVAVSTLSKHSRFSGWSKTLVGQTIDDRNQFIANEVYANLFKVIFLIVLITTLTIIVVNVGFRPLKKLLKDLNSRDIHDLTPVDTNGMPEEVATLAGGINALFKRLVDQIGLSKRFLENASHQLLTPIAALTLQCDLAIRQAKTESSHKSLDRIKSNAHRIADLANKLLQLSYSESYAFEKKDNQKLDLAEVAQECANSFKELSQRKHIELELKSAFVFGNKTLFVELLNNIIDNALKYSELEFNVLIETFIDGESSILQVTDSGPGIPEELRQLVTERFFRASKDTTGSGLGLAIVKEVVLVHHGEMKILAGKEGIGTLIRCSFPLV
jgi:two-component system sensor histidine kinase TctE